MGPYKSLHFCIPSPKRVSRATTPGVLLNSGEGRALCEGPLSLLFFPAFGFSSLKKGRRRGNLSRASETF